MNSRRQEHDGVYEHPLCVLYSSGTTGIPKAIVHGHGGILLEHLKMRGGTSRGTRPAAQDNWVQAVLTQQSVEHRRAVDPRSHRRGTAQPRPVVFLIAALRPGGDIVVEPA